MKIFLRSFAVTTAVLAVGLFIFGFANRTNLFPKTGQASASTPSQTVSRTKSSSKVSAYPAAWDDHGIFSAFYGKAYKKLSAMSLSEKVGQMLLARCPSEDAVESVGKYHLGGYVLFEQDFKGKSAPQVISTLGSYQSAASIPMLMAVDEEGGTVVRISENPKLSKTKFKSPHELYAEGGLAALKKDASNKAALLKSLGINLNLAPVSDVSTNPSDYIYKRALGKPAKETGAYVSAVVGATRSAGLASTLKHFPGYGDNVNTHTGIAIDKRPYSTFTSSDFVPFEDGIAAGAECVLVSHNVVECMDKGVPASLSPKVHGILRNDLHFTGVIMTDDLSMDAIKDYTHSTDPSVKAVLAGNDLLLTTDFKESYDSVLAAAENGTIPPGLIDKAVFRVLAFKYADGIMK